MQVEKLILLIKQEWPTWGAPKVRERLITQCPSVRPPAKSTVHAVLAKHGLVKSKKRRRYKAEGPGLTPAKAPNELWCTDYKGEFMMGNRKYCYPLTVTDFATRFLIGCEGLETTQEQYAESRRKCNPTGWLTAPAPRSLMPGSQGPIGRHTDDLTKLSLKRRTLAS